jgi:hypothetical protein
MVGFGFLAPQFIVSVLEHLAVFHDGVVFAVVVADAVGAALAVLVGVVVVDCFAAGDAAAWIAANWQFKSQLG